MLELFWKLCKENKPEKMDNKHSFYQIDNDSLLVGFSPEDNDSFLTGNEVLDWVFDFREKLLNNNIKVTFSLNLLALQRVEWITHPGIKLLTRDFLYIPDEIFKKSGVSQSRLIGDSLIITARLLQLAKKLKTNIIFSVFQGGHTDVKKIIRQHNNISLRLLSESKYNILESDKRNWLLSRNVKAWTIDFK